MIKNITSKETIKRRTISDMKKMGTHRSEYNRIIDIYSQLINQYLILTKEFQDGGYEHEVPTADGSTKKAPIVATLESLRKDILQYSDRLCLNAKSYGDRVVEKGSTSSLADVLSKFDSDD